MILNPNVDAFINGSKRWKEEMTQLRMILLDCGLVEELKWRQPCYTYQGKNLFIIAAFKDFVALSFLKGALLQDTKKILVSPGEHSQSVRFVKFTCIQNILKQEDVLRAYIQECIKAENVGMKVEFNKNKDLIFCDELQNTLANDSKFKKAFETLTPGRQRAYHIFISAAKQSPTRVNRIEKYRARILQGKGMNDCVCGLSKKMPNCDGSHHSLPVNQRPTI